MIRIVVGGQLNKPAIEKKIKEIGGDKISVTVKSDMAAVMDVKNDKADYYVGACETGSGGALAMAIALLGKDKTVSISSPSSIMDEGEVKQAVDEGKIAFGFTSPTANNVLNMLIPLLLKINE